MNSWSKYLRINFLILLCQRNGASLKLREYSISSEILGDVTILYPRGINKCWAKGAETQRCRGNAWKRDTLEHRVCSRDYNLAHLCAEARSANFRVASEELPASFTRIYTTFQLENQVNYRSNFSSPLFNLLLKPGICQYLPSERKSISKKRATDKKLIFSKK